LDIGNVLGGVLIGYLTDLTYSRRTPLAVLSILLATVMQVFLIVIDPNNKLPFFIFIFIFGLLMGGAVAIISGISCADLGKLKQLSSNEKSMGTVVGIIDGTGSLGAAFGQFIIGFTA
jgi:MFS transporter, OPA family, solute carrier family 37 (glycerol-3-phosphate transporter), member 3